MIRILVCGGRDFINRDLLHRKLDEMLAVARESGKEILIIHGAARGADLLAASWAKDRGIEAVGYPAYWKQYRKAAGPIRNAQMLREGNPDVVVAFPGGSGTAHMVSIARKANVPTIEVKDGI
jgi:predicted Rossmann-fold nucleotide-binding protein